MSLLLIGLNHRTAPVAIRDRVYFSGTALREALAHLRMQPGVDEIVILCTCNRTELYAVCDDAEVLARTLAEYAGLPVGELRTHLYLHENEEAARHLFRVAAGLDSLVLGETQIAGQVSEALESARAAGGARKYLTVLFQCAQATGKRARTETGISRGAFSVGGVAVSLARSLFPDLAHRAVLVLGAGKMSELTARQLAASGAHPIYVANRTFETAQDVAARLGGRAVHYTDLQEKLAEVDILISSTSAPHPVLYREMVAQALPQRGDHPLVLIDIAVPRDIDPEVATLPGVRLYDIDDLSAIAETHSRRRRRETPRIEAIIDEELARWRQRQAGIESAEVISALQQAYETVRRNEMARFAPALRELTPEQRRAIDEMTMAMVSKLLHLPITRLKDTLCRSSEALPLFCELFGIASDTHDEKETIAP